MTPLPELMDRPAPPRLFGRRLGRPLKAARAQVLETLLPYLEISLPESSDAQITPEALFPDAGPLDGCWMEIGFGNGEHLAA